MTEPTKINWKQPLIGKRKWLARFLVFAIILFLVVISCAFLSDDHGNVGELLLFATLIAVIGSAILLLVVRFFRYSLFATACLLTLFLLGWVIENWRGKNAWENHRRTLEAKGEKFIIGDLAPAPVPDDQNFAMTPLLRPILNFTRTNGFLVWNDTNGIARLDKIQAALPSGRNELKLGRLEENTFADLTAAQEFYHGNTNYPQPATAGRPADDILIALAKFDPELKELREAATQPHARFPIEYDFEPTWGILLPHLAKLKSFTVLTEVRAIAELDLNRSEDALADLKIGWKCSDVVRDEPILIDHLVRLASTGINLQTVREGLVRHAWTDAQLIEIEKHLASLDLFAEYKLAMRGERALGVGGLDWLRRQGFGVNAMDYLGDPEGGSRSSGNLNPIPSGWFYQNMVAVSEMHEDYTLKAIDEKAHRVSPDLCNEMETQVDKMSYSPYTIFARMLLPALSKAARKTARMQTAVDCGRVACALERYRLANHSYPESLQMLVSNFIAAIPNDVIDGQPLRYRRQADGGYVLYSVGWDKTDANGEIVWIKGKSPSVDIAKGDWTWQMPAK